MPALAPPPAVTGVRWGDEAPHAGTHAYFDALVASADHWKSYSLRDPAQLKSRLQGGYAQGNASAQLWVVYNPIVDAAEVIVPPWRPAGTLGLSMTDSTIELVPSGGVSNLWVVDRQAALDDEVVTIVDPGAASVQVSRGTFGTTPAPHVAGTPIQLASNSLLNQVWLPMATEDGHTYLTTWDAWYGPELMPGVGGIDTWKTYQFRNKLMNPAIWFEVRTRFGLAPAGYIGMVDCRYYGTRGPNITRDQPLLPQAGQFAIRPSTWTRYWMLLDQRAGEWDLASLWVADETRDPVLIIDAREVQTVGVHSFQLEFATSNDRLAHLRGDLRPLVRNVGMLRDVGDVSRWLVRPAAG